MQTLNWLVEQGNRGKIVSTFTNGDLQADVFHSVNMRHLVYLTNTSTNTQYDKIHWYRSLANAEACAQQLVLDDTYNTDIQIGL